MRQKGRSAQLPFFNCSIKNNLMFVPCNHSSSELKSFAKGWKIRLFVSLVLSQDMIVIQ